MKAGDKVRVKPWDGRWNGISFYEEFPHNEYTFVGLSPSGNAEVVGNEGLTWYFPKECVYLVNEPKDEHYDNSNGSLYLFAEQQGLNAYEFDIIKRIVRCRKKGQFVSDLEKTKRVIDLYLSEYANRSDLSND